MAGSTGTIFCFNFRRRSLLSRPGLSLNSFLKILPFLFDLDGPRGTAAATGGTGTTGAAPTAGIKGGVAPATPKFATKFKE